MKKTILILIISSMVVAGCDLLGDDDNGGGSGAVGQTLTVPGGTIEDWGGSTAVLYVAEDEETIFAGPIQVSADGSFSSFEVGPIPSSSLESAMWFAEQGLNVSNPDANTWDLYYLDVIGDGFYEEIYRANLDGTTEVDWLYTDRDVRIHGELTMDAGTFDIDLNLKAGWNTAVMTKTDETSFRYRVAPEPSGVKWILEDDQDND